MNYRYLFFLFMVVVAIGFSQQGLSSTSKPPLKRLIRYADFIGLIELEKFQALSNHCGFLLTGKVLKKYKGTEDEIRVIVRQRSDFSEIGSKHFLIAFENKSGSGCLGAQHITNNSTQSIFPFYERGGDLFMVSRKSFLSTRDGVHYVAIEGISGFVAFKNRLYALARWPLVEKRLNQILGINSDEK